MPITSTESPHTVRTQLHNSALPAANTDLITAIGPTTTAIGVVNFKIYAFISIAGNLILRRSRSAVTVSEQLAAVTAAQLVNIDNIPVDQGETINVRILDGSHHYLGCRISHAMIR
jgi:hypothetical protein